MLKGHVGRYHRAIATGEFANVIGPSIKPIFAGGWDPTTAAFGGSLFQITSNENLSIDPSYDSPRTDQYILSLEHQLGSNMGIAVNLVKKEGRDFGAWRDVGSTYEAVQWIEADDWPETLVVEKAGWTVLEGRLALDEYPLWVRLSPGN